MLFVKRYIPKISNNVLFIKSFPKTSNNILVFRSFCEITISDLKETIELKTTIIFKKNQNMIFLKFIGRFCYY